MEGYTVGIAESNFIEYNESMFLILHERWFTEGRFPVRFEDAFTSRTWLPLAVALTITALATVLWRGRGRRPVVPGPLEIGMT